MKFSTDNMKINDMKHWNNLVALYEIPLYHNKYKMSVFCYLGKINGKFVD